MYLCLFYLVYNTKRNAYIKKLYIFCRQRQRSSTSSIQESRGDETEIEKENESRTEKIQTHFVLCESFYYYFFWFSPGIFLVEILMTDFSSNKTETNRILLISLWWRSCGVW